MLFLFSKRLRHSGRTSETGDRPFIGGQNLPGSSDGRLGRQDGGITYLTNEFWTAGQRQAHAIHEVSYRACFKPQLPEFFIKRLTKPADAVYDPFMGRGTTPVQAGLMGRRPVGNDINPLSVLITRPRLRPPALPDIARRLGEVPWHSGSIDDIDLLVFYSEKTLKHICALRNWLLERAPLGGNPDPVDDWIRMVAINRLTGHSPGFFSVFCRRIRPCRLNPRKNQPAAQSNPGDRDVLRLILRKSRSLLSDGSMPVIRTQS